MNHQQTLAKMHMTKLLARANEEKLRRQKQQEKIEKAIEEREKKKTKSKGKKPFGFAMAKPTVTTKESNMTGISMDELKEFIDELADSEEDELAQSVPAKTKEPTQEKPSTPLK